MWLVVLLVAGQWGRTHVGCRSHVRSRRACEKCFWPLMKCLSHFLVVVLWGRTRVFRLHRVPYLLLVVEQRGRAHVGRRARAVRGDVGPGYR